MRKLAELWESIGDPEEKKVQCHVCAHHCIIASGKRGFCLTRENIDGILFTLIYGSCISSGSVDPVEKKPLYHFYPGSSAFSIATVGCSLRCKHCQNWELSKSFPNSEGTIAEFSEKDQSRHYARSFPLRYMSPELVVERALRSGSRSIAYTYNEPLIWFEFVRETSLLAHQAGLKNVLVTSGYSSLEANEQLIQYIDAANIDIKGFTTAFYKKLIGISSFQPVLDTCVFFKEHGVHVEITNLIIPEENDNLEEIRELVIWIRENLGKDTPLHFSAYHPMYEIDHPRTPSNILTEAWRLAKEEGLQYVFMGNVSVPHGSNTVCPKCGELLIQREGYRIAKKNLTDENRCGKCGEKISGIF
jgi:pyruvate formate lyase activating enzyme